MTTKRDGLAQSFLVIEREQHTPHIVEVTFSEASYYADLIISDVTKAF